MVSCRACSRLRMNEPIRKGNQRSNNVLARNECPTNLSCCVEHGQNQDCYVFCMLLRDTSTNLKFDRYTLQKVTLPLYSQDA